MLTRELAGQIEASWNQSQNPVLPAVQRFEALLNAGVLLARVTVAIVDAAQNMWDNSGAGVDILTTTDGSAAPGGQYDVAHIKDIQMMYLSYKQWLETTVSAEYGGNPVTLTSTPRQLIMKAPAIPAP